GKQNCPAISDPRMEVNGALCGFCCEVRSGVVNSRNAGCIGRNCGCGAHWSSSKIRLLACAIGRVGWIELRASRNRTPTRVAPGGHETFSYPQPARVYNSNVGGLRSPEYDDWAPN